MTYCSTSVGRSALQADACETTIAYTDRNTSHGTDSRNTYEIGSPGISHSSINVKWIRRPVLDDMRPIVKGGKDMPWTNPDYQDDAQFNPEPLEEDNVNAPETTVSQELLTAEEIGVLADCRRTLKAIMKRDTSLSYDARVKTGVGARPSATDIGRLLAELDHAEHAIFHAMSTAQAYCGVEVLEDDMYAR